jgi:hypothetical protein
LKKITLMKFFIKKLFFLIVMLLPFILLSAQVKIENVPDAPGKLIRGHNTLHFINSFKVLPTVKAASLANVADKVMDVICRLPQVSSPVGFNAKVDVAASDLGLKEKEPHLEIFCYLRYLVKDSRYTGIKESLDGADLYLKINDFGIFSQMGNYWKECSDLKFPLFFEELALTDSTNNYIEFQYKGDPVRIVIEENKPLLVPLTRKEFVQFLIARSKYRIKDDESTITDLQKNKKQAQGTLANPPSYLTSDVKKALGDGIAETDKQIMQFREGIKNRQANISRYQEYLNKMLPAEAAAAVRLDYDKKGDGAGMGSIGQLVPVGRREGQLLVKLNPDYYDHSPGTPAAKIMVMYYAIPMLEYRKVPNYLEQSMLDMFNHIDYHQLKESMK